MIGLVIGVTDMSLSRVKQLTRVAFGFHNYVKRPLTLTQAFDNVKRRMDNRERNFLDVTRVLIYNNPYSPYRKLLLWAGCKYEDLKESIRHKGIEKTLEKLRDEGVYITLEEFKSKIPICRKGLTIETCETDFDNPFLMGKIVEASTSGSRSKGSRVMYDWNFIEEEADNEMILYQAHDLLDSPLILWLPGLPAISGIHNLLMNLKFRRPPVKWFSQLNNDISILSNASLKYISWLCKLNGLFIPQPEFVSLSDAPKVARWIEKTIKVRGSCVLRTYTSSAIRVVKACMEEGIDITGCTIFVGGEPLTKERYNFFEACGIEVFPRYVATETGLIGASCKGREYPDDMHLYIDRLAVIQRMRETFIGNHLINSFLFTTLSRNTGKVLFNTEIGDFGHLKYKGCNCILGELGMNVHISMVRSHDKLTGEGMTLLGSEFDEIVGELIIKAGGSPDDYQFWETQDSKGCSKLIIAVSPDIKGFNEMEFSNTLFSYLYNRNKGTMVTASIWQQAETFEIIRAYPEITKGFKKLQIVKK